MATRSLIDVILDKAYRGERLSPNQVKTLREYIAALEGKIVSLEEPEVSEKPAKVSINPFG